MNRPIALITTPVQAAINPILNQLAQVYPTFAPRAAAMLEHLLIPIQQSMWPEVAWSFSPLTATGFPVEFAFTSWEESIRYTLEIAGPETAEAAKLSCALQQITDLSGCIIPTEFGQLLHTAQAHGNLHYGAWLGGRHSENGDRFKLYVEISDPEVSTIEHFIQNYLDVNALLLDRQPVLRMVGYDLLSARTEFYFLTQHLELHHLYGLLDHIGTRSEALRLIDFIQTNRRWFDPLTLPGTQFGFSYAFTPGELPTFTLFLSPYRLWGSDEQIREQIRQLAAQKGWEFKDYLAVIDTLLLVCPRTRIHGLLSLTIVSAYPLLISIGLTPRFSKL